MFNKDDLQGLESMGFTPEDIQKLLSIDRKEFLRITEKKTIKATPSEPKPRGIARPTVRTGELLITYIKKCVICGFEHSYIDRAVARQEWNSIHQWYKRGNATLKVPSCSRCRDYLMKLDKEKLVDLILKPVDIYDKRDYVPSPVAFPEIRIEDETIIDYPVAIVDLQAAEQKVLDLLNGEEQFKLDEQSELDELYGQND